MRTSTSKRARQRYREIREEGVQLFGAALAHSPLHIRLRYCWLAITKARWPGYTAGAAVLGLIACTSAIGAARIVTFALEAIR